MSAFGYIKKRSFFDAVKYKKRPRLGAFFLYFRWLGLVNREFFTKHENFLPDFFNCFFGVAGSQSVDDVTDPVADQREFAFP